MSYYEDDEDEDALVTYRAGRRRRTAITMLVIVAAIAGLLYYVGSYWKDSTPQAAASTPTTTCTAATGPALSSITVNVYNATTRNGLAAQTASHLKAAGFTIGTIANDPLKKTIKGVAEIRYGTAGAEFAKIVQAYLPKATLVADKRTNATVDVALGDAFSALATPTATSTAGTCATSGTTTGTSTGTGTSTSGTTTPAG